MLFIMADADSKAEISSVTNVSTMELCDIKTTVCDCLPAHVSQSPISTIATASD
jgi:hypothetical protein